MTTPSPNPISSWKTEIYTPTAAKWPYGPRDFERQDERPDAEFYSSPKFVTHIDNNAIQQLKAYYDSILPEKGRVLDFCSSWISHYPDRTRSNALEVYGMGLNKAELDKNPLFGPLSSVRRVVHDLNEDPDVKKAFPKEGEVEFDTSTCTVSIDYLSKPLEVLSSLRQKTIENGTVHLAISNRAFWHKVVRRWMEVDERQRLEMVGDYLWFSGWREVEIVTVVDKYAQCGDISSVPNAHKDPLWIVRAKNATGPVNEHGA